MRLSVRVKPGSRKGPLVETVTAGDLVVYLSERAVDGQANQALVKILAKHFEVRNSQVEIITGHRGRLKLVDIKEKPA